MKTNVKVKIDKSAIKKALETAPIKIKCPNCNNMISVSKQATCPYCRKTIVLNRKIN